MKAHPNHQKGKDNEWNEALAKTYVNKSGVITEIDEAYKQGFKDGRKAYLTEKEYQFIHSMATHTAKNNDKIAGKALTNG